MEKTNKSEEITNKIKRKLYDEKPETKSEMGVNEEIYICDPAYGTGEFFTPRNIVFFFEELDYLEGIGKNKNGK